MASQPIALPGAEYYGDSYNDYPMQSASPNTDFNPASYQRHFLGSPISWKMGSFGNRYIPSQSPTARLLNGLDPAAKGSVESDRGSIINAFNVFNTEVSPGDYARNYSCCNLQLNDLHALLEHFEEVHIVRQAQYDSANNIDLAVPFNPVPMNSYSNHIPHQQPPSQQLMYNSTYTAPPPQQPYAANNGFDPDDMDLGDDESSVPQAHQQQNQHQHHQHHPNHHPVPHQAFSHQQQQQQQGQPQPAYPSTHSSPDSGASSTPPETPIISTPASAYSQPPPPTAYPHAYSSYIPPHVYNPAPLKTSSSSLDGALGENPALHPGSKSASPTKCVTPSLLFDQGPATAGPSSTSSSDFGNISHNTGQRGSKSMPGTPLRSSPPPLPAGKKKQKTNTSNSSLAGALTDTTATTSTAGSSSSASSTPTVTHSNSLANLSAATLATLTGLTSSKPFKCPKPNCNKSYKQANGLKYHMTHGSCVFTPPREVEQVRAIIGEHQRARQAAANGHGGEGQNSTPGSPGGEAGVMQPDAGLQLSESELKELEREADKRLRPFACGVGDCTRRYKNMNGLRYHYQHSGDHGAIGLAMLANGTHECISQNSAHGGDKGVERGRARSGERAGASIGLNGVKKERSKSNRHDGLSSASTSRTPSRNVSRVGTPVPALPPLPPQQPPSQQSQQTTFPQNPPSTATLSLQMIPTAPSQQATNATGYTYQQGQQQTSPVALSTQMSQLGVQSAPASPLGIQYSPGTFQQQQQQAQLGLSLGVQVQGGSHPPSPLGQGSFAVQQQQMPQGYGEAPL